MTIDLAIIAEGHGEVTACGVLVARVLQDQGRIGVPFQAVRQPRRHTVLRPDDLRRACETVRVARPSALLITSDLDDGCPAERAPELADQVRSLRLPFPTAVVLFHREYETLFLAAPEALAGRAISLPSGSLRLANPSSTVTDPESRRDAKGWVSDQLLGGVRYKPTVHQLALTRTADIAAMRASGLSSFRRLESALIHLCDQVLAEGTGVYPPSP